MTKKNWIKKLTITRQNSFIRTENKKQLRKEKKKLVFERGPPWCHRVLNERKELQAPLFFLGSNDGDPGTCLEVADFEKENVVWDKEAEMVCHAKEGLIERVRLRGMMHCGTYLAST